MPKCAITEGKEEVKFLSHFLWLIACRLNAVSIFSVCIPLHIEHYRERYMIQVLTLLSGTTHSISDVLTPYHSIVFKY